VVVRTLVAGVDVPGYASLLTVVLTLGALNLLALGMIGEYVGRIAVEVRARPLYVVEAVIEPEAPVDILEPDPSGQGATTCVA
jgi:hypothetical protein